MKRILSTPTFDQFEAGLKDLAGRARIQARIQRLADGNPGDCKHLSIGIVELRIDFGPGYRVYYVERDAGTIVILLAGGDKSTQSADIKAAQRMVEQLKST